MTKPDAHRACQTTAEREQLALVLKAQWSEAELQFARLFYFKNGRDHPTPASYRCAIADLVGHYRGLHPVELQTIRRTPPKSCRAHEGQMVGAHLWGVDALC